MVATNTDKEVKSIDQLLEMVSPRVSERDMEIIRQAYDVAAEAHKLQKRSSGEPYILHPLAVAGILAEMKLDVPTISAALMHDVAEDTAVTVHDIEKMFGQEVASLVDAVTKLSKHEGIKKDFTNGNGNGNGNNNGHSHGHYGNGNGNGWTPALSSNTNYKTDREVESLRKMLLGLAKDTRVVLIKLADRLHNMRTLSALKPEKQKRIAKETLDIYAPLANRLGIWEWKQELEDLGFRYAEVQMYQYLERVLQMGSEERMAYIQMCTETLQRELAKVGITNIEIKGRIKQLYSLWRKMQRKNTSVDLIRDAQAIRVVVNDDDDDNAIKACYIILGRVHQIWRPIPGEFDDYISVPKDNQYRSLHTAVVTDDGNTLEVQIRTQKMNKAAEFGIAAHWLYKDQGNVSAAYMQQIEILRQAISALGNDNNDAQAFVDAMKIEHLEENIYCFTPKGKSIEMPLGSTVLDFAYHVHTDVGHACRGAKVNGMMMPLTHKLAMGDQVEIINRNDARPSRDWLHDPDYLYTLSAKNKVRAWFRRQDRGQNIVSGREIIERELHRLSVDHWLSVEELYALYHKEIDNFEDFLERVGYGQITSGSISGRVLEEERRRERAPMNPLMRLMRPRSRQIKGGWVVGGAHNIAVHTAPCCSPQPGDAVVGYISVTDGIRLHRRDCDNLRGMENERMIPVHYEGEIETYEVHFEIAAADRTGLLADLTQIISHEHINILGCNLNRKDAANGVISIYLSVELPRADLVTNVINKLNKVKHVFDVRRINPSNSWRWAG